MFHFILVYKMNMHLSKALLLCLLLPTSLWAGWSGINFSIGDESIPIKTNNKELTLTTFNLLLSAEDKTADNLHIGAIMAKTGITIDDNSTNIDTAADTIGLYLYFPYQFNEVFGITSRLAITKSISSTNNDTKGEAEYLSKKASLGLSVKWQSIRITPTINAISINGDFKEEASNSVKFSENETIYSSIYIDYFSEKNSYIRFSVTEHSESTFEISFVTRY